MTPPRLFGEAFFLSEEHVILREEMLQLKKGADALRIACLQMTSGDDVDKNLEICSGLLARASGRGVELAVLPEMFAFMHPGRDQKMIFCRDSGTRSLDFLRDRAKLFGMAIVAGSMLVEEGGRFFNRCYVYGQEGQQLGFYDKIHLFDVDLPDRCYRESEQIIPGHQPGTIPLKGWTLGLSICYDLRFPELYRCYAASGVELLPVPAAFTVPTGAAHWELLLRARAIENQAYVLAAAQIGCHPGGRKTYGHSMIIDPWGEILVQASNNGNEQGEIVVADLSRERIAEVRQRLPALDHRRLPVDTK